VLVGRPTYTSQLPRSTTTAQWRFAVSLMRDLAGDLAQLSTEQSKEVFEVRGIVIPIGRDWLVATCSSV
jgi:hypothetical protein